jgi:hypothetical protein
MTDGKKHNNEFAPDEDPVTPEEVTLQEQRQRPKRKDRPSRELRGDEVGEEASEEIRERVAESTEEGLDSPSSTRSGRVRGDYGVD